MRRWWFPLVVVVLTVLVACRPATPTPPPTPTAQAVSQPTEPPQPTSTWTPAPTQTPSPTFTSQPAVQMVDDLGQEILLEQCPQRIISLAPSITESLFAIGAGDLLVGRDTNSRYPPEVEQIPDIGSLYQTVPLETMLALEPDLVIAAEIIAPDQVEQIRQAGLVVFWQANPNDFEGLYENLRTLARLTCRQDRVEALITQLQARVEAVVQRVQDVEKRPLVFYELDATDPANPWTSGPNTFIDYAIRTAGGENLGALALDVPWGQVSVEKLLELNPDIIILADAPYGVTPEAVGQRAGWDQLRAVQEGRVYPFDPGLLSVPGPRLVEGLAVLAVYFYPERFCESLGQEIPQDFATLVCPAP